MKHFVECIKIKLFKTVVVSKGNIGSPRNSGLYLSLSITTKLVLTMRTIFSLIKSLNGNGIVFSYKVMLKCQVIQLKDGNTGISCCSILESHAVQKFWVINWYRIMLILNVNLKREVCKQNLQKHVGQRKKMQKQYPW